MSMNALEIAVVVGELEALTGLWLLRAHQPREDELVLELRENERHERLLISASDDLSRLHLVTRRPENPKVPFGFVSLLRARLEPSRLLAVAVQPGERVARLDFEARDGEGRPCTYRLLAELTGRHANVFLLDAEGLILGSLRPNRSRTRRLTPGNPYSPLIPRALPPELMNRLEDCGDAAPFAYNRAACAYFEQEARAVRQQERLARTKREIHTRLGRLERSLRAAREDMEQGRKAPLWRRWADLLQIHFPQLSRGLESITLPDLHGEDPTRTETIALDPALSPQENITRYYQKARKVERGAEMAAGRVDELESRRDHLLRLGEWLEEAPEALEKVRERLGLVEQAPRDLTRAQQTARKRLPYRRFVSAAGLEIRVGRSAADNDRLTLRHCRGDDFWLHASGRAGSHVVVVMPKGGELDSESLLDAATLAAHYTRAGKERIEVMYTRGRHVRKLRKAAAGEVLVARHKSLMIEVDPERLRRLMQSSPQTV